MGNELTKSVQRGILFLRQKKEYWKDNLTMNRNKIDAAEKCFADDLSQKILRHRCQYAKTGDVRPLLDMVLASCEAYPDMNYTSNVELLKIAKLIHSAKERNGSNPKIIIWGAKDSANTPLELIYEYMIFNQPDPPVEVMVCDNNPDLWGTERPQHNPAQRLPILAPSKIKALACNDMCFVVIAINSSHSSQRVVNQLLEMGFAKERIIRQIPTF